jgi:hypothetical protein
MHAPGDLYLSISIQRSSRDLEKNFVNCSSFFSSNDTTPTFEPNLVT